MFCTAAQLMKALVNNEFIYKMGDFGIGLVHTVVSISACGAEHPGSIPGLDSVT